jgi:VanZ family protein
LPAILWAVVVLSIGSLHHIPTPSVSFPIDKVGHFCMYGLLGALTGFGWMRSGHQPHVLIALALAISVGLVDEIHQRYVPGRSSDIADFAADAAGVCIAFTFAVRLRADMTGTE